MSLAGDVEALKPSYKPLHTELDLLGKYQNDLSYLEHGKMFIEKKLADQGINDEIVNKKLDKLNKSIEKLKSLIEQYEKELEKEADESGDSSETDSE
jgi:uncharacterized membrane protein YgaE (UPF0421/DUF939 family)